MKLLWVLALVAAVQALRSAPATDKKIPTVRHGKHPGAGYKQATLLHGYSPATQKSLHFPKYPVLAQIDGHLADLLKPRSSAWYLDFKFWLGLVLWAGVWISWIVIGRDSGHDARSRAYLLRSCWALGLNLVILSVMEFSDPMMGIVRVCMILIVQSVGQSYLRWEDNAVRKGGEFTVDTLYLDLGAPLLQILFLVLAQIGVWWYYITAIQGNVDMSHISYFFWLWSFITMQMTMIFDRGDDSVLGSAFPTSQWYSMVCNADQVTYVDPDGNRLKLSKVSIGLRGALGFFCNTILRDIMSFTIPLMLMKFSEPMDFVVYCVGVNFICTVDDMSDKTYKVE